MILRRIQNSWGVPWQRMLYIMFVAQLMTGLGFSSIFPFLPLYVQSLGSAYGLNLELLAGLVYSGQAFTMMIAAPFWGQVADRYGRKLMVERSMFGGTIILLLMAFARSAEDLVILRAIQGLITGTVAATNALVAATAPREHTGYAMGTIAVGMGAGVALGPMMGGAIADTYGYGAAFYVTSLMLFLAGVVVLLWVKEPDAPRPVRTAAKVSVFTSWRDIFACPGVPAAYMLSFLNQLCRNMLLPVVPLFIPLLMPVSSLINTFTGLVTGISSATTTVSGVFLGRLGDRIGQRKVLITSLAAGGLILAPQGLVQNEWQLLILQAFMGVIAGGITPSISALLARYTPRGAEGVVYGLDNSVGSGARSIAPIVGSAVMFSLGVRAPFATAGAALLLTALVAALALPRGNGCGERTELR